MMFVKLDTGFNIEVDFPISPMHRRMIAWIIDLAVMLAYSIGGIRLLDFVLGPTWRNAQWTTILFSIPILLYHLLFEITMNGQSLGKKAMSIKVLSLDGGQPSISQYLIRWIFRLVDFPIWIMKAIASNELPWWCMVLLFAGMCSVMITQKSQRIGDLVAGTIIIDTKTTTSWQDTVFTQLESAYQPRFPEVMHLSDKDINTLKSIIETVKKKKDYNLATRISDRIQTKLSIRSDQDPLDFLETLLKDYNYYATK